MGKEGRLKVLPRGRGGGEVGAPCKAAGLPIVEEQLCS